MTGPRGPLAIAAMAEPGIDRCSLRLIADRAAQTLTLHVFSSLESGKK
ncbi:hypothetical protein AB395_00003253 [Sinorhizobium fredii CCBAU 45436]|nr:hypothetical protein SF83666_c31140 [Sinorhizobium fredii CCBAU 83666]AWI58895.1 hypothetical protein AB395_00003253 [Sinorhizobium fredii CCBAU 45436]AWM26602.1 hypothetical protein AOX55_00003364 [Sinorhizobium fredii CCBAU 25509]